MKNLAYLAILLCTLISCNDDSGQVIQELPPLIINNFLPNSGYIGDEVVIDCENISTSVNYSIYINDLILDNINATDTTLTGNIPSGAISGDLSIEYNGDNLNVGFFEIKEPLLVTSYSPTVGYVGDEFKIQAENIDTTTN